MPDGDAMEPAKDAGVQPGAGLQNGAPLPTPSAEVTEPADESQQQQQEWELTQTDHLNKSLLTSFLARLNDPNSASSLPPGTGEDSDDGTQPPSSSSVQTPSVQEGGTAAQKDNEEETRGGQLEDGDALSPWLQDD